MKILSAFQNPRIAIYKFSFVATQLYNKVINYLLGFGSVFSETVGKTEKTGFDLKLFNPLTPERNCPRPTPNSRTTEFHTCTITANI